MDKKTAIVGIKRRISYQSLAETLYVEPHSGISSGSPGRQQLRRIIKGLEKAGLIQLQSSGRQLIFSCLLAQQGFSVQKQPDTKPTHKPDTKQAAKYPLKPACYEDYSRQADIAKTDEPDTPHNSVNSFVCVEKNFEKFWATYPQREGRQNALIAFKTIAPDAHVFSSIMEALTKQIEHRAMLQTAGHWVPNWKYPANWLTQQCWKDPLTQIEPKEKNHAKGNGYHAKKLAVDILWQSCKDAQFDFDNDDETSSIRSSNVVQFTNPRSQ